MNERKTLRLFCCGKGRERKRAEANCCGSDEGPGKEGYIIRVLFVLALVMDSRRMMEDDSPLPDVRSDGVPGRNKRPCPATGCQTKEMIERFVTGFHTFCLFGDSTHIQPNSLFSFHPRVSVSPPFSYITFTVMERHYPNAPPRSYLLLLRFSSPSLLIITSWLPSMLNPPPPTTTPPRCTCRSSAVIAPVISAALPRLHMLPSSDCAVDVYVHWDRRRPGSTLIIFLSFSS
jgi:hypothetical protein